MMMKDLVGLCTWNELGSQSGLLSREYMAWLIFEIILVTVKKILTGLGGSGENGRRMVDEDVVLSCINCI